MRNLGIGTKLLFSTGVLAFGYLLFLGLVQWTGGTIQHHLRTASDSLFPAALASQEAEAGFQKLTKDYKDAVLMQDSNALSLADADSRKVSSQLQIVSERSTDSPQLEGQVTQLQAQFKSLNARLRDGYSRILGAQADPQLPATIKSLVEESAQMDEALKALNENISNKDFQAELNMVAASMSRQHLLTLILLVSAIAFAIITTIV